MGAPYAGCSPAQEPKRGALVQSDMVGLVALNFVLRLVLARVMHVTFVTHVLRVRLYDSAADSSCLGIPTHVVADLKVFCHAFTLRRHVGQDTNPVGNRTVPVQMPLLQWNPKATGRLSVCEESEATRAASEIRSRAEGEFS